jgi:hypothetical protein
MSVVEGVVSKLQSLTLVDGSAPIYADRRWRDPEPGHSVIVVSEAGIWSAGRNTAESPAVRVSIYSAPSEDQDDAESVGEPLARQLRQALHIPYNIRETWGNEEVLGSTHVGSSGPSEAEGHEDWRVRSLTFELSITGNDVEDQAMLAAQAAEQEAEQARRASSPAAQDFLQSGVWTEPKRGRLRWRKGGVLDPDKPWIRTKEDPDAES